MKVHNVNKYELIDNWATNGGVFRSFYTVHDYHQLVIQNNYALEKNSILYIIVGVLEVKYSS